MAGKGPKGRSPSHFLIDRRRGAGAVRTAVSRAALAVCAAVATAPGARAANVISTWKAGVTGNWNDATKWTNSPAAATFPNNGNLSNVYDAVIGSETPVLNVPVTLHALTLNGGTIQTTATFPAAGTNGITVTGGFRWSGGYFQVPVTVPSGATFTIDTTTGALMSYGGTFTLGGTTAFVGTNAATIQGNKVDTRFNITSTGVLALDRSLTLSLPPPTPLSPPGTRPYGSFNNGGLITLAGGASLSNSPSFTVFNTGTLRVTGAAEIALSYMDSSGLIDLSSASSALTFRSPAPNGIDTTILSGAVKLAPGATLNFVKGGTVLKAPSVTNAGTINLQCDTAVNAPTTLPGVVNIDTGGRVIANSNLFLTGPAFVAGGYISGTGRVTASNMRVGYNGTGGNVLSLEKAELNVPAGGLLTLAEGGIRSFGGRVTLDGQARWASAGDAAPIVAFGTGPARFEIRGGGLVDVRPSATASFRRSSSDTNANPDVLDNAGVVQVDRASLVLDPGWWLDNSGTLKLNAGSSTTLSSGAVTNAGTIDLQPGATLLVNGDRTTSSRVVEFRVTPTGVVRVAASATATLGTAFTDGAFNNLGLVEVNGGGRLTNVRYDVTNSGTLRVNAGGTAELGWTLVNNGTVTVSGGSLVVNGIRATNAARIDLGMGASMRVAASGLGSTATFRNAAGGVIAVGPSSAAAFENGRFGALTNDGAVVVDHGRLTVGGDWSFANAGTVTVTSGAAKIAARSFTNTGGIDLRGGGGLVLAYSSGAATDPAGRLKLAHDMVIAGYHGGAWDGAGVRSASAAADPTTGVGYGPVTVAGTFLGVALAPGDVLVRHTKAGDATLDGAVNFDDLLALAKSYNSTAAHWYQGDFSYDGVVNFDDLLVLAKNYNAVMPAAGAVAGAPASFNADMAAAFAEAAVPEPGLGVVSVTACATSLLGRRRRRVGT